MLLDSPHAKWTERSVNDLIENALRDKRTAMMLLAPAEAALEDAERWLRERDLPVPPTVRNV